jgi:uncharacterized protein
MKLPTMMLPDVNVLLHAVNLQSPFHATAQRAMEAAYAAPQGVGYAWVALLGFIRLTTRPGILSAPLSPEQALQTVDTLLAHPQARIVHPGAHHAALLGRLLIGAGTAGNLTTDAHLAALAMEHNATLLTFDKDFERFAGLRLALLN